MTIVAATTYLDALISHDADMGGDAPIPAYIGERFTVRDGLIEEIEAVVASALIQAQWPSGA